MRTSSFCLQWVALVLGLAACAKSDASETPRPNLLLITLDTTRADHLGCYGYAAAKTPVLDALAARGVVFEQAYTPAPMTLPAHTTLMTGLEGTPMSSYAETISPEDTWDLVHFLISLQR